MERFWSYVDKTGNCWLWKNKLNRGGYGSLKLIGTNITVRAHRYAYALEHGEQYLRGTRKGRTHVLDHRCRVRHCVRLEHLEWVTQVENLRRQHEFNWSPQCKNGHDRIVWRRKDSLGRNFCLECRRAADRRRRARELTLR